MKIIKYGANVKRNTEYVIFKSVHLEHLLTIVFNINTQNANFIQFFEYYLLYFSSNGIYLFKF